MFVKQIEVSGMAVFAYLVACKIDKGRDCSLTLPLKPRGFSMKRGSKGYTIKYIVNTHSHGDHTMGNKRMKDLTGARIIIHEDDAEGLSTNRSR